jgi:hypothetical protein
MLVQLPIVCVSVCIRGLEMPRVDLVEHLLTPVDDIGHLLWPWEQIYIALHVGIFHQETFDMLVLWIVVRPMDLTTTIHHELLG